VEDGGVRVVVIDGLSALVNAMPNERFLALHLHEFIRYLAQKSVNAVLVLGQTRPGEAARPPIDISYLADTVLQTSHFEANGEYRTALRVLKHRTGAHDRSIRETVFGPGGMRIDLQSSVPQATVPQAIVSQPTMRDGAYDETISAGVRT
jgi:circadian clock protein KaiC